MAEASKMAEYLKQQGTQGGTQFGPFGRLAIDPNKLEDLPAAVRAMLMAPINAAQDIRENYRPGAENEIVNQAIGQKGFEAASATQGGAAFPRPPGSLGANFIIPSKTGHGTQLSLPLEGGFAGLPMDLQRRMLRAQELGWRTDEKLWHGTSVQPPFEEFKLTGSKLGPDGGWEPANFFTPNFEAAKEYGTRLIPTYHRGRPWNLTRAEIEAHEPGAFGRYGAAPHHLPYQGTLFNHFIHEGKMRGFDSVRFPTVADLGPVSDQVAVLNPSIIRSVNAKFDPKDLLSPNILSGVAGTAGAGASLGSMLMGRREEPEQ